MAQYKSLLHYLDKKLPRTWSIALRHFFWFIPFVRPVNTQVEKLRILVNHAKKNPDDFEYLNYYFENRPFFVFGQGSVSFSARENELLPKNKEEKRDTDSLKLDSPMMVAIHLNRSPPAVQVSPKIVPKIALEPKESSPLIQLLTLLEKDNWFELLPSLFASLDPQVKKDLIHQLIIEYKNNSSERLKISILFMIEGITTDLEAAKKLVFNELQNTTSISDYLIYLTIKGNIYRSELIALMDQLGEMQDENGIALYKVQRDFIPLSSSLRDMRNSSPIYQHELSLQTLQQHLQDWQKKQQLKTETITRLVQKIADSLSWLLTIIHIIKADDKLSKKIIDNERKMIEDQRIEDDRHAFAKALRTGGLMTVSYQRIRELYPADEAYETILAQCHKLQITLFDANDESARKHALAQQHTYADEQKLFGDSNLFTESSGLASLSMSSFS